MMPRSATQNPPAVKDSKTADAENDTRNSKKKERKKRKNPGGNPK